MNFYNSTVLLVSVCFSIQFKIRNFIFHLENFCTKVCGKNSGVVCSGDKTSEFSIECTCEDEYLLFDVESKECKSD